MNKQQWIQRQMLHRIYLTLTVAFVLFILGSVALYMKAEFEALRKFYPELTFYDYCILGNKLKVIPPGY